MDSEDGLGHVRRGNTPKRPGKHTKHTRKSTTQHIEKHDKYVVEDQGCPYIPMGGHPWVRMGIGDYCVGSGHEKESRIVTDGRCGSWVYTRKEKYNHKTRLGDEG